jgi:Arc/MetJ family transcription regulator
MTKRLSVTLDEELLTEVQKLTGARTKKKAIETALRAYVREKRIENLIRLAGSGVVDWDLEDLKAYRELEARES